MGAVFGKRKPSPPALPPITEQDKAILQLKTQRDRMKQFIKRKEICMERERQLAKQLLAEGRKDRALLLLKKKRLQENMIDQTHKQLDNIERMVHDLEFAEIQKRVVDELRQGNEALKKMNQLFNMDEIEKIMDETKEAAEYQEEISSLLSGQLSMADIESAEEELEVLLEKQAAAAEEEMKLPEAPSHEPAVRDTEAREEGDRVAEKKREKRAEKVAVEA